MVCIGINSKKKKKNVLTSTLVIYSCCEYIIVINNFTSDALYMSRETTSNWLYNQIFGNLLKLNVFSYVIHSDYSFEDVNETVRSSTDRVGNRVI